MDGRAARATNKRVASTEEQKELFRSGDEPSSTRGEVQQQVPTQTVRYLIQFLDKRNGMRSLPLEATVPQLIEYMDKAEAAEYAENLELPEDQHRQDYVMVLAEYVDGEEDVGISRIPLMTIQHFNIYLQEISTRIKAE